MDTLEDLGPAAAEVIYRLGYGAGQLCETAPVLILGDPADLYVCSDAALSDTHGEEGRPSALRDYWLRDLHNTVVTGSTEPRVPLSAETLAELDRVHVAGSTSHIHLGDLR